MKLKNKNLYVILVATACVLTLMINIPMLNGNPDFQLPNSVGNVSVKYINKASHVSSNTQLVWLTEEELFHKYNTDIFMGKIEDIKNIKIDFNGFTQYRAIAKIKMEKVYRGTGTVGKTVSVLLPCPINSNERVEDTKVISSMRIGMTGIFMPIKYDRTSFLEENGAKIYWQDIAEYGFLDGMRYAFLDTQNGVIFDKDAYKSIAAAVSLKDIEQYIMKMIK